MFWIAFYQYPQKYLGLNYGEFQEILDFWDNVGRACSWWAPYEKICFISDRPCEIHKNKETQLHKDGSPALLFCDGYAVWCLNGVNVPQYLAETPEGQLDIEFFKKETNADVKAEFIRKYGIDRMSNLGKLVDNKHNDNHWWIKSEYELIDMSPIFSNIEYAPHLKMKNQTTGVYHLEGVSPECRTIEQALKFRHNNRIGHITEIIK